MRICLFTSSFLPKIAGMELVVDRLAREFVTMGHEPVVLAKKPRGMKQPPEFPYPVYYYERSMSEVWFLGSPRRWLKKLHRQYSFDIIHAHQIYPTGYLAQKMAAQLGVPVVMTSHVGDVRDGSRFRVKKITNRRMIKTMRSAAAVTGVGSGVCDTINQMTDMYERAVYIGNGVDIPERSACPPDLPEAAENVVHQGNYMLSLCRLHPNKGLTYLVDAINILHSSGVALPPLLMAGAGKEEELLRWLIGRYGLGRKIILIGQCTPEARNYLMQHCRVFIQPSVTEGMPLTVLEAMAAGCAVLATDIPGIQEVITDGQNGRLVPSRDAAALATALPEMLVEETAEKMRSAALEAARGNSWRNITEDYIRLFERCIEERGRV